RLQSYLFPFTTLFRSKITKDILYECYHTFYHPSNMLLFIVGPVLPDDLMEKIKANQKAKSFPEPVKIQRKYPEEPPLVAKKSSRSEEHTSELQSRENI